MITIYFRFKTPENDASTVSSLPELPVLTSVGPPPILQVDLTFFIQLFFK